jgi:hypothetical protein
VRQDRDFLATEESAFTDWFFPTSTAIVVWFAAELLTARLRLPFEGRFDVL